MEPVINIRTKQWQEETVMEEYLDSLIFLGMPLEAASEAETHTELASFAVKSDSMDATTSDEAARSQAPEVRTRAQNRLFQRNELVRIGVIVLIIALLLTIAISL